MARSEAEKERKQRPKRRIFPKLLILVVLAAIGWQLNSLNGQVQRAQEEKDVLEAQVEMQRQENDALSDDIAEGPTQEKMMEIAREELGLIAPNERVFYDVSN